MRQLQRDDASALSITTTGTWVYRPALVRVPAFNAEAAGVFVNCRGKCGFVFNYTEPSYLTSGVTSLTFDDITGLHNGFYLTNLTSLTSLSAPLLKYIGGLSINATPSCTTINLPELEINNGALSLVGMAGLTTLNLPKLKYQGGIITNSTNTLSSLASFSMPLCEYWGGNFTITNGLLTTISLPSLKVMMGTFVPLDLGTTSLDLSSLQYTASDFTPRLASLTSISLPSIISMGKAPVITAMPNLTTFALGSTLKQMSPLATNFTITGAALTEASVDDILVKLSLLDGTNGTSLMSGKTINLSGGTSAAPSATGLAAKAVLVAAGNTVIHN